MSNDIPEWAMAKAFSLLACEGGKWGRCAQEAFARYIAEHEEPPADPLAEVISEVLSGFENASHAAQYARAIRLKLAARGIQIGKGEQ